MLGFSYTFQISTNESEQAVKEYFLTEGGIRLLEEIKQEALAKAKIDTKLGV